MIQIAIDSHGLDEEFEAHLATQNIRVVDRSDEPRCAVFEGERAALIELMLTDWGQPTLEDATDMVDSATLKEAAWVTKS